MVKRLVFSKEYREVLLKRGKVTTIRRRPLASPGECVDVYAGEEMMGKGKIEKINIQGQSELSRPIQIYNHKSIFNVYFKV